MTDIITIALSEYARLLRDSRFLEQLEAQGVDNWEGHALAIEGLYTDYPEYVDDDR